LIEKEREKENEHWERWKDVGCDRINCEMKQKKKEKKKEMGVRGERWEP